MSRKGHDPTPAADAGNLSRVNAELMLHTLSLADTFKAMAAAIKEMRALHDRLEALLRQGRKKEDKELQQVVIQIFQLQEQSQTLEQKAVGLTQRIEAVTRLEIPQAASLDLQGHRAPTQAARGSLGREAEDLLASYRLRFDALSGRLEILP